MITIIQNNLQHKLEEAVTSGIQFSLIENNINITPLTYCKDYFQDIFWSQITGRDISIYGFKCNSSLLKKRNKYTLILHHDDFELNKNNVNNLKHFIHYIERNFEIPKSIITLQTLINETDLSLHNKCIKVRFDKQWGSEPHLLSMYLLLLRIGIFYNNSTVDNFIKNIDNSECLSNDKFLIKGKPFIDIINKVKVYHTSWFDFSDNYDLHNNSGIIKTINNNK